MIAFLEGELVEKQPTRAVMNVGGVGYEVFIPLSTYDRLPALESRCKLITHDYVREDIHALYGFGSEEEKEMFEMLLSISGVGPRIAISALSGLSVRALQAAVVEADTKRLSSVSGIGKKMAERMVVELRDKLSKSTAFEAVAGGKELSSDDLRSRDAVLALISLGYKQADAQKMVSTASAKANEKATVEDIVRHALVR